MKLTIVAMSAVLLAFGVNAQAQKSASGPTVSATPNGSTSVIAADKSVGSTLTVAPISATPNGSSTVINPTKPTSNAAYVVFDVSGINSWDSYGSANNETYTNGDGGTGAEFTGIGWDVTIATVGGSWLSEARIYFDGSDLDGSGLFLTPGSSMSTPGTATFSSGGPIDLTDNGIPNIPILADGLLHMEFYEGYDDAAGAIDATWTAGTLTLLYDKIGFDVAGINSWDSYGSANNETYTNGSGGAGSVMTGIGWDVTIATVGGSWLSEARVYFDGSDLDGSGLFLTPGSAISSPGTATFSSGGIIDLTDNGIPDIPVLADGLIHMEFYEGFDDAAGVIDATWTAGTLDLVYATCGTVTEMTAGCAGNGGFVPNLAVTGCMSVGDSVDFSITNMDGGAYYFLVSSFSSIPGNILFPSGCSLDIGADHIINFGINPGVGAGGGSLTTSLVLPIAGTFYQQVVVIDSAVGKCTSNSLEYVINP